MLDLFYMGGPLFMGILTLVFLLLITFTIQIILQTTRKKVVKHEKINRLKSIGLLALVIGVLGQLIGLFSAFQSIEEMGSVSQHVLMGGLKVSSITTIYGLIIYLISILIGLGIHSWISKLQTSKV